MGLEVTTSALALFALAQSDSVTIATPASLPCFSHARTREENVETLFNFRLLLIFCSVRADFGLEFFGGNTQILYLHTICVLLSQTQKVSGGRIRVIVAIGVSTVNVTKMPLSLVASVSDGWNKTVLIQRRP